MFYSNINIFTDKENKVKNVFDFINCFIAKKQNKGLFNILPIGIILKNKIENIINHHMVKCKGQQVIASSLFETQLYNQSGRKEIFGNEMFSFKNRNNVELLLGPTMEEVFINMIGHNLSYKKLPILIYQNTKKYRDELRVRNSIIRCYEFLMHDAYYFTSNKQDSKAFYLKMKKNIR